MLYRPAQLIKALGGNAKAAEFFGVSRATVSAWRHRGERIPPDLYFKHQQMLTSAGIAAHPGIWFKDLREEQLTRAANGWRL